MSCGHGEVTLVFTVNQFATGSSPGRGAIKSKRPGTLYASRGPFLILEWLLAAISGHCHLADVGALPEEIYISPPYSSSQVVS
jgi:hypothetical protein